MVGKCVSMENPKSDLDLTYGLSIFHPVCFEVRKILHALIVED